MNGRLYGHKTRVMHIERRLAISPAPPESDAWHILRRARPSTAAARNSEASRELDSRLTPMTSTAERNIGFLAREKMAV